MINEVANLEGLEQIKAHLSLNTEESMNQRFIGEYVDKITHLDTGEVEIREGRNCIINDIGKLVACLFKVQPTYTGLTQWAVGSGADSWDPQNPPVAQPTDTLLVNEIGRKAIPVANIVFVDGAGVVTATVTNRIQINLIFTEADCNGVWREFAIFGGNATSTRNSGIAINRKTHGVIVKTNQMIIERQIRFTFN